jgi:hypothetical protein
VASGTGRILSLYLGEKNIKNREADSRMQIIVPVVGEQWEMSDSNVAVINSQIGENSRPIPSLK